MSVISFYRIFNDQLYFECFNSRQLLLSLVHAASDFLGPFGNSTRIFSLPILITASKSIWCRLHQDALSFRVPVSNWSWRVSYLPFGLAQLRFSTLRYWWRLSRAFLHLPDSFLHPESNPCGALFDRHHLRTPFHEHFLLYLQTWWNRFNWVLGDHTVQVDGWAVRLNRHGVHLVGVAFLGWGWGGRRAF